MSTAGTISYQIRLFFIGDEFAGKQIGLLKTDTTVDMTIKFRQFEVKTLDLKDDIISN